jgi:hypothetical protein
MGRRFLPSGRVRYFPCSEYLDDGRVVSRLAGRVWKARVRRKVVDTGYLEGSIPAIGAPPFQVADGVRCLPAGQIARIGERPESFVIIGAGKTALDTCVWLLEQGVPEASIRWVKPREAWWINRRYQQPHALLPQTYNGLAIQLEAMAQATSIPDLFARLENDEFFLRVDPAVPATMFRGAVVSQAELELLRRIRDVVRLGHVRRIERDRIVLDEGTVATSEQTLYVHCSSRGLARRPLRPIFGPERVTVQPFQWGFACYQFATLGVVEATVESDDEKNRLCPPMAYWDATVDYLSGFLAVLRNQRAREGHAALASWSMATRLNPLAALSIHLDDPLVIDARGRIKRRTSDATSNLTKLLGASAA